MAIEDAVKAVMMDLIVRHHNAARREDRLEREFLVGLIVDLERAFPTCRLTAPGSEGETNG